MPDEIRCPDCQRWLALEPPIVEMLYDYECPHCGHEWNEAEDLDDDAGHQRPASGEA